MHKSRSNIEFILDNKIISLDFSKEEIRPTLTLLQYLRSLPNHKGTKEGCSEGDCGACTVVIGTLENNKISYKAVDSCLIFLPMVHGKQIITIENLEQKKGNQSILHPVQQSIIDENGTQCGFCTPGIAMSLFALYKNSKKPDVDAVKDSLSGNLCRCTGYNSIIKAAQKACKNTNEDHFVKNEQSIIKLLEKINNSTEPIHIVSKQQEYYKPFSLKDALALKNTYKDALIVSGCTDCGLRVTKKHEILPLIIDVSDVDELSLITENKNEIRIGAAAKLENIKEKAEKNFPAFYNILNVFGSKQIRFMATLGGNVGSASPIGDTLPVLFAYDATVQLQSTKGKRDIKISDFIEGYRKTNIFPTEIITQICIPKPKTGTTIKSYKVSKRKELDISTVSAAFSLKLSKNNTVEKIVAAYGGMAAYTKRATHTETFLKDKIWNEQSISEAVPYLEKDFQPISDARAEKTTRTVVAKNLLLKFLLDYNN